MSLPIFQRTIVDSSGNIQPGASVAVRNETTGDLVTIYADREGGTAKANPFLADAEGFATFYVETGEYQVTATTPAGSITWSHVAIGDTALLELAQPTGSALVGFQQAGGVARTAESKLRESVSVKDFGAVGDGVTIDSAAVQIAIDYLHGIGGGDALFPYTPNGYLAYGLFARNGVRLVGDRGTRVFKPAAVNASIIGNPGAASNTPVDDFEIDSIIFDAQATGAEMFAVSAVVLDGVRRTRITRSRFTGATGYGLAMQAYPEQASGIDGPQEDICIEDCEFDGNGFSGTGNVYDGLDIKKSIRCKLKGINAHDNANKGWGVRGSELVIDGAISYDNGADGFEVIGGFSNRPSRVTVSNIQSHGNGASGGLLAISEVDATPENITRYSVSNVICHDNAADGLKTLEAGGSITGNLQIAASNVILSRNGAHGLNHTLNGADVALFTGLVSSENGGNGINNVGENLRVLGGSLINNTGRGYAEDSGSVGNTLIGVDCQNNTAGAVSAPGSGGTVFVNCPGVNGSLDFSAVANAVNALSLGATAANTDPTITVKGNDTNRGIVVQGKGSGAVSFSTVSPTNIQFKVGHGGSTVTRYLEARGSTVTPQLMAEGSGTDIDLALTPKGAGRVRIGTLVASSDAPITGYIEIKDSSGTVRRLAVIG